MELREFWRLIKTNRATIAVIVAGFFVLSLLLTVIQPLKYSSELRLLVVQSADSSVSDPYAITRANEYLSEVFSKVSYSTSFFNRVQSAGFGIDGAYFGATPRKISQTWNKTIEVKKDGTSGIIVVTAYHPDRDQAQRIARAAGQVLITQNGAYHGWGDKVSVKLLDDPITSHWQVKPNIIFNLLAALFLGLLFALAFVYLFPQTKINWQRPRRPRQPIDAKPFLDNNFFKQELFPEDEWRPDF